ncbi:glycosyltransferase [Alteribacillus bidgolensis]|uniref:Glycosyl transferases group 1 n=1 Tax=Alteribacillus bidgolensis TaxID=930129 RepID=A0A1G8D5N0_9BACI|nr:glycosyltransferase [Alteribacillus bidgolensis]SDH53036.1 Glycosyl transferases group 1 [Alteribacillus bidgolensis]
MKTGETLNVLYLTPYYYSKRGNATTAKRMKEYLNKAGVTVNVFAFKEETASAEPYLEQADIVHALHVRKTAEWLTSNEIFIQKPFLLTTGGTDINIDLKEKQKKDSMAHLLEDAAALTVFTEDGKEKAVQDFPFLRGKTHVIPQAVNIPLPKQQTNLELPDGFPNILLPAGLRPVKDVLYVLDELDEKKKSYPNLRFMLIGEPLNKEIEQQVLHESSKRPWFTYHPPVEPEEMHILYKWADAVVNTSESEGQPVSLLEGMTEGVPALARNNPGNKSVVQPGCNGYLFSSPGQFSRQFEQLFSNDQLYQKLSEQARDYVLTYHHPVEEAKRYIELYKNILE